MEIYNIKLQIWKHYLIQLYRQLGDTEAPPCIIGGNICGPLHQHSDNRCKLQHANDVWS
jgi:hypothetical protein